MTWTKFSERLPEESATAVFVSWDDRSTTIVHHPVGMFSGSVCPIKWRDWLPSNANAVMWHPITYPEVPKEETQEDKDLAWLKQWKRETWKDSLKALSHGSLNEAVLAALRYERAEVAKELSDVIGADLPSPTAINRLRRRVGLDK